MPVRLRLAPLALLIILLFALTGCAASRPQATHGAGTPSPTPIATDTTEPTLQPSPTATGGLVVTVLATDVPLKTAPDDRAGSVSATFTVNGNQVTTIVYVSGELAVLNANVTGADGVTRWTQVRYRGQIGPLGGQVDLDVTGYVRSDLVSALHAPVAPAVRTPTPRP
jgi:hypothetical protein